jgi:hypothetical protein
MPEPVTPDQLNRVRSLNLRETELRACLAGFLAPAFRCPPDRITQMLELFVLGVDRALDKANGLVAAGHRPLDTDH